MNSKLTMKLIAVCMCIFALGFAKEHINAPKQLEKKEQLKQKENINAPRQIDVQALVDQSTQAKLDLINKMNAEKEYYYATNGYPASVEFTQDNNASNSRNEVTLTVGGGSWDSEITWAIDGTEWSGPAGTFQLTLDDGTYTLLMYDSYGDGWNGATASFSDASGTLFASCGLDSGSEGSCEFTVGGDTPVPGCTDPSAPEYSPDATIDDGSCWANCAGYINYIADGYCDSANNNEGCAYDGGDCCGSTCEVSNYDCIGSPSTWAACTAECLDPNANDDCCADESCDFFPETCEDDGLVTCWDESCAATADDCPEFYCADGYLEDCDGTDECGSELWIGDGICDGYAQAFGVDFCCYDLDGGDCTEEECSEPVSCEDQGLVTCPDGSCAATADDCPEAADCDSCEFDWTAYGAECCDVAWDQFGITCAALEGNYGWDCAGCECPGDCESSGLITCPDGSCAATADDCPEAGCADIGGVESWIGDGYCDGSNNNETCDYDGGDCCGSTCVVSTYDCIGSGEGSYGACYNDCLDPDANDDCCNDSSCDFMPETCEDDGLVTCWDGSCAATEADCPEFGLATPYNLTAVGVNYEDYYMDIYPAIQWNWDDDNEEGLECSSPDEEMYDCIGTGFCADESPLTGYDCLVGCENDWLGDGYCDDGTWGFDFQCDDYGWDCGDCAAAGHCDDIVTECPDPNGYCDMGMGTTDTTTGGECEDGTIADCSGDGDCGPESWIGDGWCDGVAQAYGINNCCYDLDGGDCTEAECEEGGATTGGSPECEDCVYDFTPYGAECCDAAWDAFGFDCATLEADFNWDCEGCSCPGDGAPGYVAPDPNSIDISVYTGLTHEQIMAIKQSMADNRRSVFNLVNPPTIYNIEGDLILQSTPEDRLISYDLFVSCDACVEGGPYEGTFTGYGSTEALIYGFDEGSEACGAVRAVSGNTGDLSAWTDPACAPAGEPTCAAGDANNDGSVNVTDIVSIVNLILSGGATVGDAVDAGLTSCSDYNGDGMVNVTDIVGIVNYILSGGTAKANPATSAVLNNQDGNVSLSADGSIDAVQMTLTHGNDFAIELTDDAMVAEYKNHGDKTILVIVVPETDHLFTAEGNFTISEVIVANMNGNIDVAMDIPTEFSVSDAYPNPFNPVTSLNLTLPSEVMVDVKVYSVTGQVVDVITSRTMAAGYHTLEWDASDLSSGMYFIRTEAGENLSTQKVMLLK